MLFYFSYEFQVKILEIFNLFFKFLKFVSPPHICLEIFKFWVKRKNASKTQKTTKIVYHERRV